MAKSKDKKGKRSKPSVKVADIKPSKDVKGGRKGKGDQQDYLKVTMEDVLISS